MAKYRIERWYPSKEEVRAVDKVCFPLDELWWSEDALWWRAVTAKGDLAGYAALRPWAPDNAGYLARAGVMPDHRGRGLQRRLIRARVQYAKRSNYALVMTYTLPSNYTSSANLIREGLMPFWPSVTWGGLDACYWILRFKSGR